MKKSGVLFLVFGFFLSVFILSSFASAANTCNDTDGGQNVYVKGMVNGTFNGQYYNYTDYCVQSTQVKEYYCTFNNESNSTVLDCPKNYVCSDGACKKQTHKVCDTGMCKTVDGAGSNECSVNSDCTHTVCQSRKCVVVNGKGSSRCTTDYGCQIQQVNNTNVSYSPPVTTATSCRFWGLLRWLGIC